MALVLTQTFSQSKKLADRLFFEFAYPKAAKLYETIYQKGDSSAYVINRIALSYYKNAETAKSMVWYEKLFKSHPETKVEKNLFRYAQSLRANGFYKKSDSILSTFDKGQFKDASERTNYLLEAEKKANHISIRNLAINTEYSDFGGFVFNDQVYFASASPVNGNKKHIYKWNNQPYLNLYKSNTAIEAIDNAGKVDSVYVLKGKEILQKPINTRYHESNAIITKDGKTMYFTRVNLKNGRKKVKDKKNTINLKIYRATLIDGEWSNVYDLPFNSDNYSVGHPALSLDEKTLYFTSDMPGSIGETDIFKVAITEKGYGKPVNLGKSINTEEKEMFPYIASDGTLYFSSNGHIGLGLLDIFKSKMNDKGEFEKPINLETPFNSKRDDFSFHIDKDGRKGFFSSNREKGKGDDDIYSFYIYKDICTQLVSGVVRDLKTKKVLADADVKLVGEEGDLIAKVNSAADGSYKFENVPCGTKFTVLGSKMDYRGDRKESSSVKPVDNKFVLDLNLEPLIIGNKIVIRPIYFDFDKSDIREEAAYELEHIVNVMNNHPDMVIKIESHTDCRGSKRYNLALSDRRAKSTRDYIISRGIAANRIQSAIGYGEGHLLNHCNDANILKCTEEEHQLNRRSYFIIVKGGPNVEVKNIKPTVIDPKRK